MTGKFVLNYTRLEGNGTNGLRAQTSEELGTSPEDMIEIAFWVVFTICGLVLVWRLWMIRRQ